MNEAIEAARQAESLGIVGFLALAIIALVSALIWMIRKLEKKDQQIAALAKEWREETKENFALSLERERAVTLALETSTRESSALAQAIGGIRLHGRGS